MEAFLIFALAFFLFKHLWVIGDSSQRSRDLQLVAQEMDLDYYEKDEFNLMQQLNIFPMFQKEDFDIYFPNPLTSLWINGIQNVLPAALDDTPVFLFDYTYQVNRHRYAKTVRQTIFIAHIDHDKISKKISRFARCSEFWHVEEHLDSIMENDSDNGTPELRCLVDGLHLVHIEICEGHLLIYKPGVLIASNEVRDFYVACCHLTDLFRAEHIKLGLLDQKNKNEENYSPNAWSDSPSYD